MSVSISGTVLRKSGKAVLVDRGHGDESWIPLSVIEDGGDDIDVGDEVDLEVASWFARKEGLE